MSAKKRRPQILQYVEDYLEDLQYLLEVQEKTEVEVKIEEKEESLRLRVISTTPDGKKSEIVGEAPRLFLQKLPLSAPTLINVMRPPGLTRPALPIGNEISTVIRLQQLYRVGYLLQTPIKVFEREVRGMPPLSLPLVSPWFYSWLKERITPISLPEQQRITVFTLKGLLRLSEILPRLPKVAERIESKINITPLTPTKLFLLNEQKASLSESAEALRSEAEIQQLKGKGLLELLFPEDEEKFRRLRGAAGVYAGEPILIVLPESGQHLWYLLWVVCRELYREAKGTYPTPVVLVDKGCEIWLEHFGLLAEKIVVLHKKLVEDKEKREWFRRRLQEAFSQGLGFLIMVAEKVDETIPFLEELCKPYKPLIVAIQTLPEPGRVLKALAKVLGEGFGIPYGEVIRAEPKELSQLDTVIAMVDRAYRDFQSELLLSNYLAYVRRDVGERESEDHIAMKTLAIKYLSENLGIKPEKITCTCKVGEDVVADIYVEERSLAVECETEFGTAPAPLLKIFESVRKYIERPLAKPVSEIWVIVRNWSAILHLGDLLWAEDILKEELKKQNKKVKFLTADIYGKSLRPLSNIAKNVSPKPLSF
jgi:hypothetical protein